MTIGQLRLEPIDIIRDFQRQVRLEVPVAHAAPRLADCINGMDLALATYCLEHQDRVTYCPTNGLNIDGYPED